MDVALAGVSPARMPVLKNLMQLYQYDFTEYNEADVDDSGLFHYEELERYGWEPGRYGFLIRADDKWAGFALIMHMRTADTGAVFYWMAEFFVMKKYRRRGIGSGAAKQVFSLFPGTWRVGQLQANDRAQSFWRRAIGEFTDGDYKEIALPDWAGPAQQFTC